MANMTMRAIFACAMVSFFLLPREPDIGFGAPGVEQFAEIARFQSVVSSALDRVDADLRAHHKAIGVPKILPTEITLSAGSTRLTTRTGL